MWRANKTSKKAHSHVHARSYFGEDIAKGLLEWLNSPRKRPDLVEEFLQASMELALGVNDFAAVKKIKAVLHKADLKRIPYLHVPFVQKGERWSPGRRHSVPRLVLDRSRWDVQWDPVSKSMIRAQAVAFSSCLDLGATGLLGRIRTCKREACGQWFFAKFEHQRFHSEQCQQQTFKSSPEWKKQRAEYMKRLRHEEKLRERKWLLGTKRKAGK
jgi:hypothetical protein